MPNFCQPSIYSQNTSLYKKLHKRTDTNGYEAQKKVTQPDNNFES